MFNFPYGKIPLIVLLLPMVCGFWLTNCSGVPSEYQEFFALPLDKHGKAIHSYTFDKQVEIYLIAMTVIRPPEIGLVHDVASNGKTIVSLLIKRLATVKTEDELSALLYALLEIDMRVYSWRKDPAMKAQVKQATAMMTTDAWRERIEKVLSP